MRSSSCEAKFLKDIYTWTADLSYKLYFPSDFLDFKFVKMTAETNVQH